MAKKLRSAAEGFLENAKENTTKVETDINEISTKETKEENQKKIVDTNGVFYLRNEDTDKAREVEQPKQEEVKMKKAIGQPRKYDEQTKHVSFALPLSVVENLKILAGLKKTNQTQLILSLIQSEIDMNADKIEAYKELLD